MFLVGLRWEWKSTVGRIYHFILFTAYGRSIAILSRSSENGLSLYSPITADVFEPTQCIGVLSATSEASIAWDFFTYQDRKEYYTCKDLAYTQMIQLKTNIEKYVEKIMRLDLEQLKNFESLADSIYDTYYALRQRIWIPLSTYSNQKNWVNWHLAKEISHYYDNSRTIDPYNKYRRADPAVDLQKRWELIDTMLWRESCFQYIHFDSSLGWRQGLKDIVVNFLQPQEIQKNECLHIVTTWQQ